MKKPKKSRDDDELAGSSFIDSWVSIADQAVEITRLRTQGLSFEEQCEDCEQSSIDVSLHNLMTFPFIESRVKAGVLKLHGWCALVSSLDASQQERTGSGGYLVCHRCLPPARQFAAPCHENCDIPA